MRRGGRGSSLQVPWRRHDGAIPSDLHLERGYTQRYHVKVVGLAACSIAISFFIWRLLPERPHLLSHGLLSRNPGFVFPLYQYYKQYANGSYGTGGRERWRGSRLGHGRGVLSDESNSLFELHSVHRSPDDRNGDLYIEIELGDPPKVFYFYTDTGSGSPWVLCDIPNSDHVSTVPDIGPNGLFLSKEDYIIKCIGPTASLCRALQFKFFAECKEVDEYKCFFSVKYLDDSVYRGVVVNESITVSMQDKSERKVFVSFGCVLHKTLEALTLLTDGVVGLGKCEGSLVDQLSTSKAINRKVLGVCLAKKSPQNPQGLQGLRKAGRVGYITLGMDFVEKNDQSKLVWAKLSGPE
ncbi:hypothetical protein M758_9G020400 [Ceratodon purpureus]|nr:hypothetical protein M758_9G020400 [Ceratodon purpureus]